jgi:hypothetical protein
VEDFRGSISPAEFDPDNIAKSAMGCSKKQRKSSLLSACCLSKAEKAELMEAEATEMVGRHLGQFRKYLAGSVHLTRPYVEKFWAEVQQEPAAKYILTLDVISCPVIPVQSNAFTVAAEDWSAKNWNRLLLPGRGGLAPAKKNVLIDSTGENWAAWLNKVLNNLFSGEFLASFCTLLGHYPTLMAHRNSPDNVTYELAQHVKIHLDRAEKSGGGRTPHLDPRPSKAVLVILDRGMDLRTVLMHDLSLQVLR